MSGDFQQIVFTGIVDKTGEYIRKQDGFQAFSVRVVSLRGKNGRTIKNVFDIKVYGELAGTYANTLHPGCAVLVAGRISARACAIEGDTRVVNIDAFAIRVLSVG